MFFKNFVRERLLGINPIEFYGSCEQVLYEESEFSENEPQLKSIYCKQCHCWYHLKCQNLEKTVDGDWLSLLCQSSGIVQE